MSHGSGASTVAPGLNSDASTDRQPNLPDCKTHRVTGRGPRTRGVAACGRKCESQDGRRLNVDAVACQRSAPYRKTSPVVVSVTSSKS
jgi:hypothetical protein